jgi:hypothetical protein
VSTETGRGKIHLRDALKFALSLLLCVADDDVRGHSEIGFSSRLLGSAWIPAPPEGSLPAMESETRAVTGAPATRHGVPGLPRRRPAVHRWR